MGRELLTVENRKQILRSIIVMNLKKSPGENTAINYDVKNIAKHDMCFLNEQFQIYFKNKKSRPDIIICGGKSTSNIFNSIIDIPNKNDWRMTERGIFYYEFDKNRYFIKYIHPAARISDNLIFYGLIDAIKEIVKSN